MGAIVTNMGCLKLMGVLQGPRCPLATRILLHCAQRQGDEDALMAQHSHLTDSLDDQLSLAALHFNRGHYQVDAVLRLAGHVPVHQQQSLMQCHQRASWSALDI